ncbi:MAG: ATP-binding protein [Chthoniobacterales bacterium]
MEEFFRKLFDTTDFPARWHCGNWSDFLGWLYILSDLAIFAAYVAIPLAIVFFIFVRRQKIVFPTLYWFFAAFILSCGLTHLIDATIFWHPWYRLSALVKFITALASWSTVILILRSLPHALALPGAALLNNQLKREIEERKRAATALQASTTQLKLAMEHSRLGDWSWNPATDLTVFSERGCEIFGLPPGKIETWANILTKLHPDDRERAVLAVQTAVEQHGDYDIEYRVLHDGGREAWVSARGRAEYDSDGKVTVMLGTVQDITERKLIEHERERLLAGERHARSEAERAGLMKDEFLATLSHELRTPLNAILGWTHLLKNETDEEQRQQGLAVIERNTRVQSQLVDDLLDMNKIITGKIGLVVQRIHLRDVIQAALDSVRLSAQPKNITFEAHLDANAHLVMGDPSRLQQIIWNLLTNAIKFTPVDGRVEIRLENAGDSVEISVTDSGAGISPEFLPHVFDRFRQADSSITRKHGGLGLGLAIVKNLAEIHGGSVSAESAGDGLGSTFRLRLPAASEETSRTSMSELASSPLVEPVAALPRPWAGLDRTRVLLVENDADSLALLTQVLKKEGATVHATGSGAEALAELEKRSFDLIISDIGMPEMDGFALIEKLRRWPATKNGAIPAIALTAFARPEDRDRALACGFNVFLSKPVDPTDLLNVASRCIATPPER